MASGHEDMGTGQAERLMPLLEELLVEAGLCWRDIGRIGVGVGPGNFTGVRIGVAAARGLALSLGVRAVGVSVLEALAEGAGDVVAVQDARRGMAYAQGFGRFAFPPALISAEGALPAMPGPPPLAFVGELADLFAQRHGGSVAAPAHPLAEAIARIAALAPDGAAGVRPAPLYLREADAAPAPPPPPRLGA